MKGVTSFNAIKMLPDGSKTETFKETALALGILEPDQEWDACLAEAASSFMPKQLCSLFKTILIFGDPSQPFMLWEKYKHLLADDLLRQKSNSSITSKINIEKSIENECLLLLQDELEAMGKSLQDYKLPIPDKTQIIQLILKIIQEEIFNQDIQKNISKVKYQYLNTDQKNAFDTIMCAVQDKNVTQRIFS